MKKYLLLIILLVLTINTYSLELWAKAGTTQSSSFDIESSQFQTSRQPAASLELIYPLSDNFKISGEVGYNHLYMDDQQMLTYIPIGGNVIFTIPSGDTTTSFFLGAGYNLPYVNYVYEYNTLRRSDTGAYFLLGSSIKYGLFMVEVNYSFNNTEVTAAILQDDGETTILEKDSTFINFLTLKIGYELF